MKRSRGDRELAGAPRVQSFPYSEVSALNVGLSSWAQDGDLRVLYREYLLALFSHCIQHTHLLEQSALS